MTDQTTKPAPTQAVLSSAELGKMKLAFEAHMDATQPPYWRTTAHARDAWQIWLASAAATRERCADVCEELPPRSSEYDAATLDCSMAIRRLMPNTEVQRRP